MGIKITKKYKRARQLGEYIQKTTAMKRLSRWKVD